MINLQIKCFSYCITNFPKVLKAVKTKSYKITAKEVKSSGFMQFANVGEIVSSRVGHCLVTTFTNNSLKTKIATKEMICSVDGTQ